MSKKVVGASIVNRFPYVVAPSYCREPLSSPHYVRRTFMDVLEASGRVALQFLMPGESLDALMTAIANVPEDRPADRFAAAGLATHDAPPIFDESYLVYQCRLSRPSHPGKVENCGLTPARMGGSTGLAELPVHYDCRIVESKRLGTHVLVLGEVENMFMHRDVTPNKPLEWCQWAGSKSA
jgi:flavin reductase (DIM6/NTAB) family NADH-FMN oxidoreductase RutF